MNQFNRLHIVLGRYMTPLEVRYFTAASASEPFDSIVRQAWGELSRQLPVQKARTVEFERQGGHKGVSFYTGKTGSPRQKTLIIAFSGGFQRVMLPTHAFLDCLNPALYDVLMLRDFEEGAPYLKGIGGLGGDFFEAMHGLSLRFMPHSYRRTIALGTSGGGAPALLSAMLLGLNRAVSVGGADYSRIASRLRILGISEEPYEALLASRPEPFPDLLIVYAAGHKRDADAAHAMHRCVPSQLLGEDCSVHGVLGKKLEEESLPQFLAKVLGQSLEDDESIVTPRSAQELSS